MRGGAREREGWIESRAELVRGEDSGHLDNTLDSLVYEGWLPLSPDQGGGDPGSAWEEREAGQQGPVSQAGDDLGENGLNTCHPGLQRFIYGWTSVKAVSLWFINHREANNSYTLLPSSLYFSP